MRLHFRPLHIPSDWLWVRAQVPVIKAEDTSGIVAQDIETGNLVGAAVFDNWSSSSAQAHFMVTSPMVLRHGFLQTCLDYLFNKCKLTSILGFVASNNEKALKLNQHMGFTAVHTMKNGYETGVDYVIMEMQKENCRYLPMPNEKGVRNGR